MSIQLTKVNNSPADFEGLDPNYERRLEIFDRKKNHNKFWRIWVYGQYVVRHWGRHGTKGQHSVHRAWNEWGAKSAAQDLYYKKSDKGYRPEVGVLDRIVREIG
jgi:predicted DNA-binding WGR domain protein